MVGAVALRLPGAGYAAFYAKSPLVYALLGSIYIGYLMWPKKDETEAAQETQEAVKVPE